MHHHSGGFIYDGKVVVLKDDIKRYVLGLESGCRGRGELDLDLVIFSQSI
jgi:hypothetical protein